MTIDGDAWNLLGELDLAAGPARGGEHLLYHLGVSLVDDGHGEVDVAEMAWTLVHLPSAGLTFQAGFDDAQPGVHQAHIYRKAVVVIRVGGDYLGRGHVPDLIG